MHSKRIVTEHLEHATEVNTMRCYQCGKCTAGCEMAQDMDITPNQIMRLLQTDNKVNYEKVLKSKTIWLCLSCENCYGRCPMEIDLPKVMDYLRQESLRKNMANPYAKNIISFHRSFLGSIKATGRLYEIGLIAGYKLRTFNLTQDVLLAPIMFAKGKLNLIPEMIKGKGQIKKIFNKTINK